MDTGHQKAYQCKPVNLSKLGLYENGVFISEFNDMTFINTKLFIGIDYKNNKNKIRNDISGLNCLTSQILDF